MRLGANLGKSGRIEEGKEWSESNYLLEVKLTELVDEVEIGCGKQGRGDPGFGPEQRGGWWFIYQYGEDLGAVN